jgi:hypothetical protein
VPGGHLVQTREQGYGRRRPSSDRQAPSSTLEARGDVVGAKGETVAETPCGPLGERWQARCKRAGPPESPGLVFALIHPSAWN